MKHDGGWKKRGSRYLFESRWYNLRQDDLTLPNGEEIAYTLIEHPGWVMIVPLLDDGGVVMEKVYRHTLQCTALECPSGGNDGETPEVAARRELEEETGYRAEHWEHLGHFAVSSGIGDEQVDLFLATGLSLDGEIQRESTEQMELCTVPFEELYRQVLAGELPSGFSALSILLAWLRLESRKGG